MSVIKGSVVQLKSGGPKMTVYVVSTQTPGQIWCQWFDGAVLQKGEFSVETVRLVQEQDKGST